MASNKYIKDTALYNAEKIIQMRHNPSTNPIDELEHATQYYNEVKNNRNTAVSRYKQKGIIKRPSLYSNNTAIDRWRKTKEKTVSIGLKWLIGLTALTAAVVLFKDKAKELGNKISDGTIDFSDVSGGLSFIQNNISHDTITKLSSSATPSTGRMSEEGLNLLIKGEGGLILTGYKDNKLVPTIGAGHTGLVRGQKIYEGMKITEAEARELLRNDIADAEAKVRRAVKVPISQKWFDALVNFTFINGHIEGTQLLKAINSQDWRKAQQELSIEPMHENRQKEWKEYVSSDLVTLSGTPVKLGKGFNQNISSRPIQEGVSYGGYTLKSNSVILGDKMKIFLSQVEGKGVITSGMDSDHTKGSGHYRGEKIDVRTNGLSDEMIVQTVIWFLRHPATKCVNFEFSNTKWANRLLNEVKSKEPEISRGRVKVISISDKTSGNHLDISVNLSKIRTNVSDYVPKTASVNTVKASDSADKINNQSNKNVANATNQVKTSNTANNQKNSILNNKEQKPQPISYTNTLYTTRKQEVEKQKTNSAL